MNQFDKFNVLGKLWHGKVLHLSTLPVNCSCTLGNENKLFLTAVSTLLVVWQEGHPACKNWMLGFLMVATLQYRRSQVHLENGH